MRMECDQGQSDDAIPKLPDKALVKRVLHKNSATNGCILSYPMDLLNGGL